MLLTKTLLERLLLTLDWLISSGMTLGKLGSNAATPCLLRKLLGPSLFRGKPQTLTIAPFLALALALSFTLFLALIPHSAFAQTYPADFQESRINLASSATYLEDPAGKLTIEQAISLHESGGFELNPRDKIHFGMTRSTYWIHFHLDWDENLARDTRILEIGPPKITPGRTRGGVELYVLNSNGTVVLEHKLGSFTNSREIKTLTRGYGVEVDAELGTDYFLRISSAAPLRTEISLWKSNSFERQMLSSDTTLSFIYGILIAMVFFNLFQYFTIRENSYLLYVIAIGTQGLFLFLDVKHLRFLLDDSNAALGFIDLAERLIYPAVVIAFILFQRSLLNIPEKNPLLDVIGRWYLGLFMLIGLLAFIPDEKYFQLPFVILLTTGLPIALYSNFDAIRRGDYSAAVHMAAMGAYLLGATVLLLVEIAPGFPANDFTNNAYNIGQIAQALLLSLSLSTRYSLIREEKERAQRTAIETLVSAERLKDDLLANVSHELRTPLFGINGLAESALREFRQNNQNVGLITKNLELIQASGDRLTLLVNDLLDFSATKDEESYIKFKPVDLNKLGTLVIAICRPLLGDKAIELVNSIDPELPLVAADEDRLQQILVNLTTNAIKFTHDGKIELGATLTSNFSVRVSVSDTGIGIHESDHETIFKSFEKLSSKQLNLQGVGLGLPIAKRLIEMHKSELAMQSELDKGSTFSFELRVSLDQARSSETSTVSKQMIRRADFLQDALATPSTLPQENASTITIMIVDDDEINRVVMGQQLAEYTLVNCSNGLDALTAVEESKPDLVLLDLMMPGINGYEVCQKLRLRYSQIELPIILVTAKNHLEDLTEGFRTGANDYLPKPFHNEELRSRVENQLKLSTLHRINEDNIRLRSLLKSYAEADSELRSSRLQLQNILETLDHGFVAFELPGKIFSLNFRAAELLHSDKPSVQAQDITSLFANSEQNADLLAAIASWEAGDSDTEAVSPRIIDSQAELLLATPERLQSERSAQQTKTVDVRLTLFGHSEGTGVLFLLPPSSAENSTQSEAAKSAASNSVSLVGSLGQAQQNVRRLAARLNVLTPDELGAHPSLLAQFEQLKQLIDYLDTSLPEISSDGEYRQQLVNLMRCALNAWEVTTQKTKIELAEESRIWAVSVDDGRLRTRTFDRYSRIEHLPKVPRWREVVRTAYFVLSLPTIEAATRSTLEEELEKTKVILKKAAIS